MYTKAYNTAKSWGWSDLESNDLATNAQIMHDEDDKLKGRQLKEFWDVNPTSLLLEHNSRNPGQKRTRFPPEPNGYAHLGHAKSMCMNFHESFEKMNGVNGANGVNGDVSRHTILRLDDTNPEVESQEFVDELINAVNWLGFTPSQITYTSDYFDKMYEFALKLIKNGDAYVCFQNKAEIEQSRNYSKEFHADLNAVKTSPNSPYRDTTPEINTKRFLDMKQGLYSEGECSLRLKMDMFHTNPNLWDPVAYRIIYHPHPRCGSKWCIYPTYDYSHCIADSLEDIDYSICTLEFETRRESYYWLLWKLNLYRPKIFEFARLEMTGMTMSKRKLKLLVDENKVRSWDDCRMPTLMGMRRRGFLPSDILTFMKEIGITRNHSVVDTDRFLQIVSGRLEAESPRYFGILDPVCLELINLPDYSMPVSARKYPQVTDNVETRPGLHLSKKCWIDRSSVVVDNDENIYGFAVDKIVRLKYGPLVVCKEIVYQNGVIIGVKAEVVEMSKTKTKGVMHWLSVDCCTKCEIRLYEGSEEIVMHNALIENDLVENNVVSVESARFQLERIGFFCFDKDTTKDRIVLNRILPLNSFFDKTKSRKNTRKIT